MSPAESFAIFCVIGTIAGGLALLGVVQAVLLAVAILIHDWRKWRNNAR